MKLEDVFFIGGLVFIGYWITKKQAIIIPSESLDISSLTETEEKPKTIVLNLNAPQNSGYSADDKYVKDYDSSMGATFSPQRVHIKKDF
jgi:hypothetical protein